MTRRIQNVAKAMKCLTYSELMIIAEWMSGWTQTDPDGMPRPADDEAIIDRDQMAANLDDWADQHVDFDG